MWIWLLFCWQSVKGICVDFWHLLIVRLMWQWSKCDLLFWEEMETDGVKSKMFPENEYVTLCATVCKDQNKTHKEQANSVHLRSLAKFYFYFLLKEKLADSMCFTRNVNFKLYIRGPKWDFSKKPGCVIWVCHICQRLSFLLPPPTHIQTHRWPKEFAFRHSSGVGRQVQFRPICFV